MKKKTWLLIGILVVVSLAAYLIFQAGSKESSTGSNSLSLGDFLPFGSNTNSNTEPVVTTNDSSNDNQGKPSSPEVEPKLRKISGDSVAGEVVFNNGTTTIVRFVEKGTGNVYEARSGTTEINRLTNTTIPKIIRAFWLPNGSGFLAQTLVPESEMVETSFVKLGKNSAVATSSENLTPFGTTISKLATDIKEIAIKPDSGKIFYYTIDGSLSHWFLANPDGTKSSEIYSSPITEWTPTWISTNTITMQTKASYASQGFLFSFDPSSGSLKKVAVQTSGLVANMRSDGLYALVSNGGSLPGIYLFNGKDLTLSKTRFNGLANKCGWNGKTGVSAYCAIPNTLSVGNFPDDWYKGTASTNDSIRKIDLASDIDYTISDLSRESGQKIDVSDLSLSSDGKYSVFRNKLDGSLWMLRNEE